MSIIIIILLLSIAMLILRKNNFLFFLVSLEIIFLAINLLWIRNSLIIDESAGLAISLILIALAAIDAAIGLSILLKYFAITLKGNISISNLTNIKG